MQARGRQQRSIFMWPQSKPLNERPAFLENYPVPEGQRFNLNSFLGAKEPHAGKYYVPYNKYKRFLQEYYEAFTAGHLLFLTEVYESPSHPYRYFMELDFDWELPRERVLAVLPRLLPMVVQTVQAKYELKEVPQYVSSMRTYYKVHLNFPGVITTELLANMCRDMLIEECRWVQRERPGL